MRIVLLYVLPLALMIYALVDCVQDTDVERTSVPKPLWIAFIVILPYFGPIAWLVVAKIAKPGLPRRSTGPHPPFGGSPRRRGPTAPDDDPDFLRKLDERTKRRRGGPTDPPTST
ncbi:MAG: PLD nuclease N-terminal domain-containing protein [Bifidobacteriaceae bacterium]|nr:PLD nuclease N-terminal domain-containing protein [Bifidobacteriaceae bacterium]